MGGPRSTRSPDCVKSLPGTVGAALCHDFRSERDSSRHKAAPTASAVDAIGVSTQSVTLAATTLIEPEISTRKVRWKGMYRIGGFGTGSILHILFILS